MQTRDRVDKIVKAAKAHKRVRVKYKKKLTNKTVVRDIAAYSFVDGYLYITDTVHGVEAIRCYIAERILSAKVLKKKFKPQWDIEL